MSCRLVLSQFSKRSYVAVLLATVAVAGLIGCAGEQPAAEPIEAQVIATVGQLNTWWAEQAPGLGFQFEAVPLSRLSNGSNSPACNGSRVKRKEVADNAFVDANCEEGILVAYDPEYVGANRLRLRLTFAHEWGHVVQAQAPQLDASAEDLPILGELQADCFAGAWAVGGLAPAELADARADVAETGDFEDVDLDDDEAHGFPEERVAAFDLGYGNGLGVCTKARLETLIGLAG